MKRRLSFLLVLSLSLMLSAPLFASQKEVSALGEQLMNVSSTALATLPAASQRAKSADFDPGMQPRVYEISKQLRCLVCQNENIADSNAELAVDLRNEVIAQVNEGKSDEEIIAFMTERYGDYVLYKPPFKAKTYFLWLGPLAFFLVALWAFVRMIRLRRWKADYRTNSVSEEELDRAIKVLRAEILYKDGDYVNNPHSSH